MELCCITGYGKRVRREKGLIVIDPPHPEKEHVKKVLLSPEGLGLVLISGDHDLTTSAIRSLLQKGTELVLLDRYGSPEGYLLPVGKSPVIEHAERQQNVPGSRCLAIAREIVGQAIRNKAVLMRSVMKNRQDGMPDCSRLLDTLEGKARSAGSRSELFGIEGTATRHYYAGLCAVIPPSFGFYGRNRNPPRDPVNALLSYGYGILYGVIRTALVKARLSPFYGVYHAEYRHQEPLVYDFIEEFRQPVVDRVVVTMIHRRQVSSETFTVSPGGCRIPDDLKKLYTHAVLERLEACYQYDGKTVTFREIIDAQARLLANALLEGSYYRPFANR
ncbi:MAG: CRISPR-associated endonuclease Cas1 2 [Methanoregulaceae archaeon PtaB.Bin009]|nr:MAG: CRISPR-associated endonuclease Cas1 2 [Methanoregulaceae archaeon PtaB.Bin009]